MSTGIFTQPAASILEDVEDFYFGSLPWMGRRKIADDGKTIVVRMHDPEEDEGVTKVYPLTADQIREAFKTAKDKGYHLCCAEDITTEQLGYGCAQDLDIIVQTACYGELVFG